MPIGNAPELESGLPPAGANGFGRLAVGEDERAPGDPGPGAEAC